SGVDSLHFSIYGQDRPNGSWSDVWRYENLSFDVPTQKWMELEFLFIEGDDQNGRFYFAVTPENQPKTVIFDIQNWTHAPGASNPDGIGHFNPFKLYTSDDIVDYIRNNGGITQVYWDDFELWQDKNIVTDTYINSVSEKCGPTLKSHYSRDQLSNLFRLQDMMIRDLLGHEITTFDQLSNGLYLLSHRNCQKEKYSKIIVHD
ncbi:MAG: hypothetical protein MRY83_15660, partial [Flavobacteriales bacterium]|nr:hypothetical protein [Flavobacteriales bacterium]